MPLSPATRICSRSKAIRAYRFSRRRRLLITSKIKPEHLLEQAINVSRGHGVRTFRDRGHQPTPVRAVEESLGRAVAGDLAGLVVTRPGHLPAHAPALSQQIAIYVIGEIPYGAGGALKCWLL